MAVKRESSHFFTLKGTVITNPEERQILVSVPLGGDDTVSVATLKAGGNGALALVDDHTVLLVDVSQYVVTRNGMATVGHNLVL